MRFKRRSWLSLLVLVLAAALYLVRSQERIGVIPANPPQGTGLLAPSSVAAAFEARQSDVPLETAGRVHRILADDREGSQHQRFVVRVDGSMTVLVAHNIDIAARVPVAIGDSVAVRGEYVWNELGGVIHWTHRDPDGDHPGGWIRHRGRLYQ